MDKYQQILLNEMKELYSDLINNYNIYKVSYEFKTYGLLLEVEYVSEKGEKIILEISNDTLSFSFEEYNKSFELSIDDCPLELLEWANKIKEKIFNF